MTTAAPWRPSGSDLSRMLRLRQVGLLERDPRSADELEGFWEVYLQAPSPKPTAGETPAPTERNTMTKTKSRELYPREGETFAEYTARLFALEQERQCPRCSGTGKVEGRIQAKDIRLAWVEGLVSHNGRTPGEPLHPNPSAMRRLLGPRPLLEDVRHLAERLNTSIDEMADVLADAADLYDSESAGVLS